MGRAHRLDRKCGELLGGRRPVWGLVVDAEPCAVFVRDAIIEGDESANVLPYDWRVLHLEYSRHRNALRRLTPVRVDLLRLIGCDRAIPGISSGLTHARSSVRQASTLQSLALLT